MTTLFLGLILTLVSVNLSLTFKLTWSLSALNQQVDDMDIRVVKLEKRYETK